MSIHHRPITIVKATLFDHIWQKNKANKQSKSNHKQKNIKQKLTFNFNVHLSISNFFCCCCSLWQRTTERTMIGVCWMILTMQNVPDNYGNFICIFMKIIIIIMTIVENDKGGTDDANPIKQFLFVLCGKMNWKVISLIITERESRKMCD